MTHPSSSLKQSQNLDKTIDQEMLSQLTSCEECDAVYTRTELSLGERAYCTCCGAELYRNVHSFTLLLSLTLTALIIFVIANSFPVIKIDLQGHVLETTLFGTVWTMFKINHIMTALVTAFTIIIAPFINLLLLAYVFLNITWLKRRPKYLVLALKSLYHIKTWAMIEVFLVGILVTMVKLVKMVIVIPSAALWAIAVLGVLLVYLNSFKVKDLWNKIDRYLG